MASEHDIALFSPMPHSTLAGRLKRAIGDTAAEIDAGGQSYLKIAFSLDSSSNWVAVRLARSLRPAALEAARHPLKFVSTARLSESLTVIALTPSTASAAEFIDGRFVASAVTPEPLTVKRRRSMRPVMAASGFVHSFLIAYLIYAAIVSPYTGIHVVNKAYRPFDPAMLVPLHYPPGMLPQQHPTNAMTLDEIREQARKKQEQQARARQREDREKEAREKAEREKAEREKAELEKAEAEKKLAEAKAAADKKVAEAKPGAGLEFNETALKDVVGKIYTLYQAGGLDVDLTNFSVMLGFKIEPDGSLSKIRILKSSGSKAVDEKAADVLWTLGESHALGTLSSLTSNSIRLDLNENVARLTITSFAPNAEEATIKAKELTTLFWFLRLAQKDKNPEVAELLALAKIKSVNSRIDADLTISRARAAQLMKNKFGNSATP